MTTKRGDWVVVAYAAQVERDDTVPVVPGLSAHFDNMVAAGAEVKVFDFKPEVTQLVGDKAVLRRAIDAELDAATARSEATVAERRTEAERKRGARNYFDQLDHSAMLNARLALLNKLMDTLDAMGVPNVRKAYAAALKNPCRAWHDYYASNPGCTEDCGCSDVVRTEPCRLVNGHDGDHEEMDGSHFSDDENGNVSNRKVAKGK